MLHAMAQPVTHTIPARLTAGDSLAATAAPLDHLASNGWAASLILITSTERHTIAGTPDGDAFAFSADSTTTAAWAPGAYHWFLTVSKDGARHTVATGRLQVSPDSSNAFDPRSHARRVLDAIEAHIEGRDYGAARFRIGDREVQTIPVPELLTLRDRYRAEVRAEETASGLGRSARIRVKF